MRKAAIFIFLYPLSGGLAGFLVAAFAVWPIEFAETFPYYPIKTELSFIYGTTIGFPVGAIVGFMCGIGLYWILKPMSHLVVVFTLFCTVSVVGGVGALINAIVGIWGALIGFVIGMIFLFAIKPMKDGK